MALEKTRRKTFAFEVRADCTLASPQIPVPLKTADGQDVAIPVQVTEIDMDQKDALVLQEVKKDLEAANIRMEEMSKGMENLQTRNDDLTKKIQAGGSDTPDPINPNPEMEKTIESLMAQVSELKEALDDANEAAQGDGSGTVDEDLKEALEATQTSLDDLKADNKGLVEKNEEATDQIEKLKAELAEAKMGKGKGKNKK